jgi:hypothetical protein
LASAATSGALSLVGWIGFRTLTPSVQGAAYRLVVTYAKTPGPVARKFHELLSRLGVPPAIIAELQPKSKVTHSAWQTAPGVLVEVE